LIPEERFDFPIPLRYRINSWQYGFLEVPMFEGLFQPTHLIIIFAIALLIFGPRKLPELGKGLGEGIRALKEGMKDNASAPTEQSKNTESKDSKDIKS
jgi:sec-independent protein translocase protein TatA